MCKSELSTNPPIGSNPIVAKHVLLGKKTEMREYRISVFFLLLRRLGDRARKSDNALKVARNYKLGCLAV